MIYYAYLQKINKKSFTIILDNNLKIDNFTEMKENNPSFLMNYGFNLSHKIIGYNTGFIIPNILTLLDYKDNEFHTIKKDCELKGYLYPGDIPENSKKKINIILDKLKDNEIHYLEQLDNDNDKNIMNEYNNYISELFQEKIKPLSIFYKIKLYIFLEGKYKYYRIYIDSDIISTNEFYLPIAQQLDYKENKIPYI